MEKGTSSEEPKKPKLKERPPHPFRSAFEWPEMPSREYFKYVEDPRKPMDLWPVKLTTNQQKIVSVGITAFACATFLASVPDYNEDGSEHIFSKPLMAVRGFLRDALSTDEAEVRQLLEQRRQSRLQEKDGEV